MIVYPRRSRRAIGRLMAPYNDIDIYVEDITYVGVYERLINRALAGRAKVTKVIPLGPRDIVISAARDDDGVGGRPRLYIVDGDLDLIASIRQRSHKNLHRLRVYSVENLLFEQNALEAFCAFACPGKVTHDAVKEIDLDHIRDEINKKAYLYIVALAVARRLDLRDKAFSIHVVPLFDSKNGKFTHVNNEKLRTTLKELIKQIQEKTSVSAYKKAKREVLRSIEIKKLQGTEFFPGKALLWFLNERVGHAKGTSLQQKLVVSYLADHCNARAGFVVGQAIASVGACLWVVICCCYGW